MVVKIISSCLDYNKLLASKGSKRYTRRQDLYNLHRLAAYAEQLLGCCRASEGQPCSLFVVHPHQRYMHWTLKCEIWKAINVDLCAGHSVLSLLYQRSRKAYHRHAAEAQSSVQQSTVQQMLRARVRTHSEFD